MKLSHLLLFSSFLAGSYMAHAQCNPQIQADTLITGNSTFTTYVGKTHYHVCSGATLTFDSTYHATTVVYLEQNATMVKIPKVNGPSFYAVVNMKDGSTYDMGGSFQTQVVGDTNSVTLLNAPGSFQYSHCVNQTFGYAQYPGGVSPCSAPTGNEEKQGVLVSMQVFPNPFSEDLNIKVDKGTILDQLEVLDMSGKVLHGASKLNTPVFGLNLPKLPAGIYFVRATTATGEVYIQKAIKR